MDSEKIRERADSVLQHAKNLLLEDESEVEDDTVENDEETVSKNGNAEDDHGENDGKKTDDENTKETKSDSSVTSNRRMLEGQLGALQVDNDRLKTELNDLQELKQRLTCNLEVQNEKHRNEVKRFDLELKTATESMAKMILTNQNEMEKSRQLRIDFIAIENVREDLKDELKEKEMLYRSELNNLNESLQQSKLENTKLTDLLDEMKVTNLKQRKELCQLTKNLENKEAWYVSRLLELTEELQEEKLKNCKDADRLQMMKYTNPLRPQTGPEKYTSLRKRVWQSQLPK
ncbi:putative leucine-rich repeat-containing protein DDB_G0290503 [Anopheles funestus]|uniref:putative leucine-rich repeat-containing protein DDB_G0290503 n=1 Tax=Anopheles funestus TaxID=62324 RepID=UPI0020C5FB40|nr:putative leucine-rich repeat-containing protein DDB_G0290503 [Anopheles funestus]